VNTVAPPAPVDSRSVKRAWIESRIRVLEVARDLIDSSEEEQLAILSMAYVLALLRGKEQRFLDVALDNIRDILQDKGYLPKPAG